MAGNQTSKPNGNSRTGAILLGISSLVLLANVGWFAVQLQGFASSFGFDAGDRQIAIALGVLKVLRTIAFDHVMTFCVFTDILVLCVALGGMLAGFGMLRQRTTETA